MSPLIQQFVMHFGEMGSRWGINRTVGQIYALLYVSDEPLNADALVERLHVSRSNVSMGLKELKAWRLVRAVTIPGDRREYWTTPEDVWEIFRVLAEERRRREVDPTLSMLRDALLEEPGSPGERHAQERMARMHELIELLTEWHDEVRQLPQETVIRLMKLGRRVQKVLELGGRIRRGVGQPASARKA